MTRKGWTVWCDGEDCTERVTTVDECSPVSQVRAEARRRGWHIDDKSDYCPACARAMELA